MLYKRTDRLISAGLMAVTILTILLAQPTQAAVFNQTPETIEKSFGRPWTKLTRTDANNGQISIVYTYSPEKFRRYFPSFPASRLSMVYKDNRVQSVQFQPYRTKQDAKEGNDLAITGNEIIAQKMEAKVFDTVLGYRPSIYKPLLQITGIYETTVNCLGDGVASEYTIFGHSTSLANGIILSYNKKCEPPYDKIKFTTERGPSGG